MACRLGDDVYEWKVEQLCEWLRNEGLNDCAERFAVKKIDGCKLLNLSEHEIKTLYVSHESKKKLFKAIEKFKKRKKGKFDRMFGGNQESHRVAGRRPPSMSHEDGVSDDDGWGSEEWDESDSGEGGDESSDDGGEYLEPEDDFPRPTGSQHRASPALVQRGLVAQLREGIAQSLQRNTAPPQHDESYADEDIYDVPPEDEEDLYEEPSDSSGGAVVVRPPAKPPRIPNDAEYLKMRGDDVEQQDTYEAPLEGLDLSSSPNQHRPFIPTIVQQDSRFVRPDFNANNMARIDGDEDECNYEVAEPTQSAEAPPPRPPKKIGTPGMAPGPKRPPKQQPNPPNSFTSQPQPGKTVYRKPPPNSFPPPSDTPNYPPRNAQPRPNRTQRPAVPMPASTGSPVNHGGRPKPAMKQESPVHSGGHFPMPGRPGSSQGSPGNLPTNSFPGHAANKPALPSKQGSPAHPQFGSSPPSPSRHPGKVLSSQGSQFQGVPLQSSQSPAPRPKPSAFSPKPFPVPPPQPTEEKRPPVVPKSRPKPIDPTKREPAPPPGSEPVRKTSGSSTGPPESPKRKSEPLRKTSGPQSPISSSFEASETRRAAPLPHPQLDNGPAPPTAMPRGGMSSHREPMPTPAPPLPVTSPTHRSGPLPAAPGMKTITETLPTDPAVPPRPPKQGFSHPTPAPAPTQVPSPHKRRSGDKKGTPLPPPPSGAVPSSPSLEQSSGSSIELSGSADEPVQPLSKRPPSSSIQNRNLPPPPSAAKVQASPMDVMREAPWYHGDADRRRSEANLKAANVNGAFLVRNSTRKPNEFSMSLLHNGEIRHLQIPMKDGKYVLGASGTQKFDNVIELVNYHRQNDVELANGGKTRLTIHAQNIAR